VGVQGPTHEISVSQTFLGKGTLIMFFSEHQPELNVLLQNAWDAN